MERYDYRKAMKEDILEWLDFNYLYDPEESVDEICDKIYDELFIEDCITGNGCNGYDTEAHCEEYVCHNLSLYFEAAAELYDFPTGATSWVWEGPATHMDCTIRIYLLGECSYTAVREWVKKYQNIEE